MTTGSSETESSAGDGGWKAGVFEADVDASAPVNVLTELSPEIAERIVNELALDVNRLIVEVEQLRYGGAPLLRAVGMIMRKHLVEAELHNALDRSQFVRIGDYLRESLDLAARHFTSKNPEAELESCDTATFINDHLKLRFAGTINQFRQQIRIALLERAFRMAQKQAKIDPLTGLKTRRVFEDLLRSFAGDIKTDIFVVGLDLDRFKAVNDTYGHPAGDEVLKSVAATLSSGVRGADECIRMGGEEMLVVMRDIDLKTARERVEKMREEIKKLSFNFDGEPVFVTASFGLSSGKAADFEELVEAVDRALYDAKDAGRDCIVVYENGRPALEAAESFHRRQLMLWMK